MSEAVRVDEDEDEDANSAALVVVVEAVYFATNLYMYI